MQRSPELHQESFRNGETRLILLVQLRDPFILTLGWGCGGWLQPSRQSVPRLFRLGFPRTTPKRRSRSEMSRRFNSSANWSRHLQSPVLCAALTRHIAWRGLTGISPALLELNRIAAAPHPGILLSKGLPGGWCLCLRLLPPAGLPGRASRISKYISNAKQASHFLEASFFPFPNLVAHSARAVSVLTYIRIFRRKFVVVFTMGSASCAFVVFTAVIM